MSTVAWIWGGGIFIVSCLAALVCYHTRRKSSLLLFKELETLKQKVIVQMSREVEAAKEIAHLKIEIERQKELMEDQRIRIEELKFEIQNLKNA